MRAFFGLLILAVVHSAGLCSEQVLFFDDFSAIKRGPYGTDVGAHTEYHYLHEAAPKGNWEISTFRNNMPASCWSVRRKPDGGQQMISNLYNDKLKHSHPILCAGDRFWGDYTFSVSMEPESDRLATGLMARYQNDRCYYLFCLEDGVAKIKYVHHAKAYHEPYEEVLAESPHNLDMGKEIVMVFAVNGNRLEGRVGNIVLKATDHRYSTGRIGLLSDVPVKYNWTSVTCEEHAYMEFLLRALDYKKKVEASRKNIPQPVVWKKVNTEGFGVGRNLRFGDLNGDGQIDILVPQVKRHGPKDANSEVGCMTAMTLDGEILWQLGTPDPWNGDLTNDVGVQIHDIDNDGKNEVIYCKDLEIVVAEGATGNTLYKAPTPEVTNKDPNERQNIYDRILGDSLFFCDLSGKGYNSDIIIKDRYKRVWAMDSNLNTLWYNFINTGHYPYAYDVDSDGRDEVLIGYSLIDDNGGLLWNLDKKLDDHADGVAMARFNEGDEPMVMCAASDEGMFFANTRGEIMKHHYIGHVQNPAVANFRDDLPGLETVSINFWGNQGIIHFYDSSGDIYNSIEPNQYGSMCLPLNWTGDSEEFFLLNANVDEGGAYNGKGYRVLDFPDNGHPDMCNAVLDITGDCRDEIVVWDLNEIWIYTQEDNPRKGKLYNPIRNSLFNSSNYQASVSLPNWQQ